MKHEFMTEGHMQEIQELYANGHGEALNAFGLECAKTACESFSEGFCKSYTRAYDRNVLKGAAVTAAAFLVIRAIVYKVKQKKSEDQKDFEE